MNDYLKDIEELETALDFIISGKNELDKYEGYTIIRRLVEEKKSAVIKFEQELEDIENAVQ